MTAIPSKPKTKAELQDYLHHRRTNRTVEQQAQDRYWYSVCQHYFQQHVNRLYPDDRHSQNTEHCTTALKDFMPIGKGFANAATLSTESYQN